MNKTDCEPERHLVEQLWREDGPHEQVVPLRRHHDQEEEDLRRPEDAHGLERDRLLRPGQLGHEGDGGEDEEAVGVDGDEAGDDGWVEVGHARVAGTHVDGGQAVRVTLQKSNKFIFRKFKKKIWGMGRSVGLGEEALV